MKQILEATQNNNAIVTQMESTIETLQARVASLELRDPTPIQIFGVSRPNHELEEHSTSFEPLVTSTGVGDHSMAGPSSEMGAAPALGSSSVPTIIPPHQDGHTCPLMCPVRTTSLDVTYPNNIALGANMADRGVAWLDPNYPPPFNGMDDGDAYFEWEEA